MLCFETDLGWLFADHQGSLIKVLQERLPTGIHSPLSSHRVVDVKNAAVVDHRLI